MGETSHKTDAKPRLTPPKRVDGIHFNDVPPGTRIRASLRDRQLGTWRRTILIEVVSAMATHTIQGRATYIPPFARISYYDPQKKSSDKWQPIGESPSGQPRTYALLGAKAYPKEVSEQDALPTIGLPFMLQTGAVIEVMPNNDHHFQQWIGNLLVDSLAVRFPVVPRAQSSPDQPAQTGQS